MADTHDRKPTGAGKSSFGLIDVDTCFRELDLPKGICFLDVACGRGAYCLKAAEIVGSTGTVFGVDLWADGIEELKARALEKNYSNVRAFVSDVGRQIPLNDQSVDVCLLATVLHDFVEDHIAKEVMQEVVRVLKTKGLLAIVEFKRIDGPPGPPKPIRLSPEDVADLLTSDGFKKDHVIDIGPYNYLITFTRD
jgi:ubiquinone/menaquinone biosynthesis C-methylase UbiE